MKNQFDARTDGKWLGSKYPIIQGAMAGIANADFVLEMDKNGILGTLSTYGLSPKECQQEIEKLKKTGIRFACNLMLKHPDIEEFANIMIAEKVPIVTLSAGYRPEIVKQLKMAGIIILAVVGSPKQAKKIADLDVDIIIAEGLESGGHIGKYSTEELVEILVHTLDKPIIAAGGISDYEGLQHFLEKGAIGIQIGTPLLLTTESPLPLQQKEKIATAEPSDIVVITGDIGLEIRGINDHESFIPCGISAGKLDSIVSVKERIEKLVQQRV